jgi:hypothetical protein
MKPTLLHIVSAAEAATGAVLLAYPPIVVRLLFDSEIAGAGIPMSRIAGIPLRFMWAKLHQSESV